MGIPRGSVRGIGIPTVLDCLGYNVKRGNEKPRVVTVFLCSWSDPPRPGDQSVHIWDNGGEGTVEEAGK